MKKNKSTLIVAALQMNSKSRLKDNLILAESLISESSEKEARAVFLPENFSVMPQTRFDRQEVADKYLEIQSWLSGVAKKFDVAIIAGSTPIPADDGRVTNTCLIFDTKGEQIGRYDKMHLFDVEISHQEAYCESGYTSPGSTPVIVEIEGWSIGVTICYDIRFPELYRFLSKQGVDVFSIPSAFTVPTGEAHWHMLTRTRAIENLAWVVAPAQVGIHPGGRETFGHSLIVDPWGSILVEQENGSGAIIAKLDRKYLNMKRNHFPVLEHRRIK